MAGPLVSIIIDNFNYARFLGAAIDSALAQSWRPLEIIVVDDGSTDGSRGVIAGYEGRVVPLLQENRGQSGAFNAGFAASRGEIVLFLDSDDLLEPGAVAEIVAHWRPGVSKLQFCLVTIDADGRPTGGAFPNYPARLDPAWVRREALRTALYPCPPTSGNAYARAFLDRVMPVPPVHAGADGPLNTLAPLYGEVVTLDRPLGRYRVHGGNDGAQRTLSAEKFARFIRHDQHRARLLAEHSLRLGIPLRHEPLDRAVLHLQYRLASLRLLPERHPIAGDTPARLAWRGVLAAFGAGDPVPARAFLVFWFFAVAFLPNGPARALIALRFVPASRPRLLGAVLRRLGVLRRGRGRATVATPRSRPA